MKKLFVFFITLLSFGITQAQGTLKNYENEKYRFSFSYPGEYLLDKTDDDEWVIVNAEKELVILFKIMHLNGKSYDSYVNSISKSIINTYFNELSAKFGTPEKSLYRQSLIGGFEFDRFSSQYLASGTAMEKLSNSMIVYLNIFRKTSHAGFIPDGIIIYILGPTIHFDKSRLTDQVINTFEKTVVFKEAIVTKPVVTTVAKKKPVTTTPVVKKPVAPKPPISNGITQAQDKLKSVKIGKQTWMVKNLDVATYRNGDPIPKVTNEAEWVALTTGAWCYYNNDSATYAATYGKLYNWYAVNDPRGLAPTGWHVPSDAEWTTLVNYLGRYELAGGKMKEKGTTHWNTPNKGATNSSGFTGLPGGYRHSYRGDVLGSDVHVGNNGFWWSSTEFDSPFDTLSAHYCDLHYNIVSTLGSVQIKQVGMSVRCLRD